MEHYGMPQFSGWLSPEGEIEQCPSYGHMSKAAEILERLNIDYAIHKEDSTLMRRGWIKVMYTEFMERGYRFFGNAWRGKEATEAQKKSLMEFLEKWAAWVAPSGFNDLYELGVITDEERTEKPWIRKVGDRSC